MMSYCRGLRRSRLIYITDAFQRNISSKTINVPVCILGGGPVGLLLSSQLSSYGIKHCVVERRKTPTKHPQAHFMNARTMEILQAHLPLAFKSVLHEMPSSDNWRDFVYCYSVTGRQFARLDQFKETEPLFWEESPTNVVHLPQNKFEVILREEVNKSVGGCCELILGYEAKTLNYTAEGTNIMLKKSTRNTTDSTQHKTGDIDIDQIELNCDYLVAADGANSIVRRSLDVPLNGEDSMHTLMNIHFTCHGLRDLLKPRSAMLYFVFNESLIAVFVAHDPEKDEWVCQIPIFPPFKNPEDFDEKTLQELLRKGLGLPTEQNMSERSDSKRKELEIDILSVNSWTMHAQVAETFTNEDLNVFLAGDAAHRFPPAGGFGMNTGLQDAHNIGWKLAMVVSGKADKRLLESYERERKPVAQQNTALSLQNYEKSASAARMLGVDPVLAKIAINTVTLADFMPLSMRKLAVNSILNAGMSTLSMLKNSGSVLGDVRVKMIQRMVDKKASLPLIFPNEDINFDYPTTILNRGVNPAKAFKDNVFDYELDNNTGLKDVDNREFTRPLLRVGGRIPHCWFAVTSLPNSVEGITGLGNEGRDDRSVAGEKLAITSTVSLSGLLHSSFSSEEILQGQIVSKPSLPKVLLLVDKRNALLWKLAAATVGNDLFEIISIQHKYSDTSMSGDEANTISNEASIYNHQELQETMQDPHYNVIKSKKAIRKVEPHLMTAYIEKKFDNGSITICDLTGRWMEICVRFLETEDFTRFKDTGGKRKILGNPADDIYCSVALRPDGHAISILNVKDSANLASIIRFIQDAKNRISAY